MISRNFVNDDDVVDVVEDHAFSFPIGQRHSLGDNLLKGDCGVVETHWHSLYVACLQNRYRTVLFFFRRKYPERFVMI